MNWERKELLGYDYNYNYNYNYNHFCNPPPVPQQFYIPPGAAVHPPSFIDWGMHYNQHYQNYNYGYSTRTYYEQDPFPVQKKVKNWNATINTVSPYVALGYQGATTRPTQEPQNFDAQEEFREKLIAYARYNRNNELMKTVVSGVLIPKINGIVTSTRVKALTNQVDALKSHEKKVSKEIVEIREEYKVKKRKFEDSCDNFWQKYKKLCEPPVTSAVYTQMVNKYYDELKHNLELIRWQKTLAWAHETVAATTNTTVPSTKSNKPLLAEILAAPSQCYHPQVSNNHHSGGKLTTPTTKKL